MMLRAEFINSDVSATDTGRNVDLRWRRPGTRTWVPGGRSPSSAERDGAGRALQALRRLDRDGQGHLEDVPGLEELLAGGREVEDHRLLAARLELEGDRG